MKLLFFFFVFQLSYSQVFFDFDEVIHYEISKDKTSSFEDINFETKNKLDSIASEIFFSDIPKNKNDFKFLIQLESIGFVKKSIDKSKFELINKIFSVKPEPDLVEISACVPVFRDIFVFKKDENIIGVAKICLDCDKFQIVGSNENVYLFGINGEYKMIEQLLKN